MTRKYNEKMVVDDGKMIYAISLKDKSNQNDDRNYIYIREGKIYFSGCRWFDTNTEFNFNDEAHRIAKEIFVSQLQVDIKRRILELKQLEEIFNDIGLSECINDSIVNNSRILLELKQEVKKELKEETTKEVKKELKKETKKEINAAIEEQVRPIARKKTK